LPIIGVGGIFNAEDAYEKIKAGASLVQVYTGLIYEGPGLVKKINQGLVKLLERDGFKNIKDTVGIETK
jgi:dihydroorotate dehydrogenase